MFYEIAGFPKVLSAVDGTKANTIKGICMCVTKDTMPVCNAKLRFTKVITKW